MGNIARRLESLEKLVATATCVCEAPEHQIGYIRFDIRREQTAEELRLAKEATRFTCPAHGERHPKVFVEWIPGL
jgi:hypothetical protein